MSHNTPSPLALTACMLMEAQEDWSQQNQKPIITVANLASAIHRLAPACRKLAVAQCNGEWRDGQRQLLMRAWKPEGEHDATYHAHAAALDRLDDSIEVYATRLDRRIAKLNTELAPFGYQLIRSGDPRGACLRMAETPVNDFATHYSIG